MIKFLLMHNQPLFLDGLGLILKKIPTYQVVGFCNTGLDLIQRSLELKPNMIIMDIETTDCKPELVVERLNHLVPSAKIIIIDSREDIDIFSFISNYRKVMGFLHKDIQSKDLLKCLSLIEHGEHVYSDNPKSFLKYPDFWQTKGKGLLSKRQVQLLSLVDQGSSNKEIAEALFITENTVKAHLQKIMEKLGAHNRSEAVAIAKRKQVLKIVE